MPDPGSLRGAAQRALEALLGLTASNHVSWTEAPAIDLGLLGAQLERHAPVVARMRQLDAEELVTTAGSGSVALARARSGWLVAAPSPTLVTSAGERDVSKTAADFRELLGREPVETLVLELRCNLDSLAASRTGSSSPWARLRALMRLESAQLWPLVLYALVLGGLSLALPVAIQVLVNTIALGSQRQPLVVLTVLLFAFLCFGGVIQLVRWFAVEVLQRRLFVRIAEDLARRLPSLDPTGLAQLDARELSHRFFEVVTLQKTVGVLLLDGLGLVLQTTVGILLLAFYHPVLLAFDVLLIAALIGVLLLGRGAVSSAIEESKAKYATASWLAAIASEPPAFETEPSRLFAAFKADTLIRKYITARRVHYRRLLRQLAGAWPFRSRR